MKYKDLAKKIRSVDIFKELTIKETSVTTANIRLADFNYIKGILKQDQGCEDFTVHLFFIIFFILIICTTPQATEL